MPSVGANRSRTCCNAFGIGGIPSCCVIESALAASTRLTSGIPCCSVWASSVKSSAIASRAARTSSFNRASAARHCCRLCSYSTCRSSSDFASACRSRASCSSRVSRTLSSSAFAATAVLRSSCFCSAAVRASFACRKSSADRWYAIHEPIGTTTAASMTTTANAAVRGCRCSQFANRSRSVSSFGSMLSPASQRSSGSSAVGAGFAVGSVLGLRRAAPTWPTSNPQFGQLLDPLPPSDLNDNSPAHNGQRLAADPLAVVIGTVPGVAMGLKADRTEEGRSIGRTIAAVKSATGFTGGIGLPMHTTCK